ncbi:hypothetical protein J5N97_007453 [Dioscorea zingiberensis]|uniref:Chalcone synthase n=1 Tax=Dioscorea zingiberensis TaxID=325984 RepID=A0A9D5DF55_9LILI|nr:hypothetical protein J5N97_007453 [Dioscorea zingiberensis]
MVGIQANIHEEKPTGLASIMAIGTANPPNVFDQSTFADYFFRMTNNEHKEALKAKFNRIALKTTAKKRHTLLTEDFLKENPNVCAYKAPSLDARQELVISSVPILAKEAAVRALKEWGRPLSEITHMIFCTMTGPDMPGADYHLLNLLGLSPTVKRLMFYSLGCYAGGTALRLAKDLAENNKGSRVLVVCAETTVQYFRGPEETDFMNLVAQAIFGDGACSMVIGADPVRGIEKPIYEIVSAMQILVPDSYDAVEGHLREVGVTFHSSPELPDLISKNLEPNLVRVFKQLGISDWNQLFWMSHPGGPGLLDKVTSELRLGPNKLDVSRHVLSEYGNMSSTTVLFVMDEMRRRSIAEKRATTGEGLEFGVLFGYGPGLTIELVALRSVPLH